MAPYEPRKNSHHGRLGIALVTENPMEVFQSVWYRIVLTFAAIQVVVTWFVFGPGSAWCGITVVMSTFALGPAIATPVMHRLPMRWFHVSTGEQVIHSVAGVKIFRWLLDASGWNRLVSNRLRRFPGTKGGLVALEASLRGNISAHGTCFIIHVLLAILSLFSEHPLVAAFWMLCPGIVVHLYPVLLQRSIMLRLYPLLENCSRQTPGKVTNNTLSEPKVVKPGRMR